MTDIKTKIVLGGLFFALVAVVLYLNIDGEMTKMRADRQTEQKRNEV